MKEVNKLAKQCPFCGNKHLTTTSTQYIYRHGDRFLVVNSVPCLTCDYCGEQYFAADVLKKIEQEFFAIAKARKAPQRMIEVPMEDFTMI